MHAPTILQWKHVKHLLRYLKGTISLDLCLAPAVSNNLIAFVDSDCAGDPDHRTSTMAFLIYDGNLIS
ncbi:unnamed protein product [Linum trigynum]|uniref:Polyprotein n=1 Tax=Linum trigynum TaxID=586398 RepID=A0AAV2FW58_9ROSI